MAAQLMPALLHPILVLSELMPYQMMMQNLAASGQVEAGFVLLWQVGNGGLPPHSNDSRYTVFHTLL